MDPEEVAIVKPEAKLIEAQAKLAESEAKLKECLLLLKGRINNFRQESNANQT